MTERCATRVGATETAKGLGKGLSKDLESKSPNPSPNRPVQREVWHQLTAGLAALSPNDYGRPWPNPRRPEIIALLDEFDDDLCIWAAKQAREIVVSQDRAPNITSLFEKKLRERAGVRETLREELS